MMMAAIKMIIMILRTPAAVDDDGNDKNDDNDQED